MKPRLRYGKGEKPKKTPSANAAAVRSGESWMCKSASSQRRTSARQRGVQHPAVKLAQAVEISPDLLGARTTLAGLQ